MPGVGLFSSHRTELHDVFRQHHINEGIRRTSIADVAALVDE
jgi:hypothetical protein